MFNSLKLPRGFRLVLENDDNLACFLAGAAAGAIVVAAISNIAVKSSILVSRRRHNGRSLQAPSKGEVIPDSDLRRLQKIHSMLDVIERDIVPLTCMAACGGKDTNMLDGAAVLLASDCSLLVASTNQEARCPLYHGAIIATQEFYESKISGKIRNLDSMECIVVLTHRPCRRCCNALLTAKFGDIYYLFDNENFVGSSDMSCSCTKAESENDEYSVSPLSICRTIDTIMDMKRNKNHHINPSHMINPSNMIHPLDTESDSISDRSQPVPTSPTARDLAESAAADTAIVTAKRRIDQLKLVYRRINTERLKLNSSP